MSNTPITRDQELDQLFEFSKLCYDQADPDLLGSPPNRERIAADFDRRKHRRDEILEAARSSRTMAEAGKKLGVTRARFAVILNQWFIRWGEERGRDLP